MNKEDLKLAIKSTLHYISSYGELYDDNNADDVAEFELSLEKEQAETNCPTTEQIIKVLEIYDNTFKGFSEYAKKETAGYIQEKWN